MPISYNIYNSTNFSKENLVLTSHEIDLSQINDITLSDIVTTIEPYTFNECSNLTKITFGKYLKNIGEHAFNGCGQLKEIVFKGPRNGLSLQLGTDCFNNIHENCLINYISSDFTGDFLNGNTNVSLLYIGGYTYFKLNDNSYAIIYEQDGILNSDTNNDETSFYDGSNNSTGNSISIDIKTISEIYIGNNITEIGDNSFKVNDNDSTSTVYIPTSVTKIGVSAFSANKINYFNFIDIANSQLEIINSSAFWYVDLKTFTFPSSVTSIGNNAFHGANHNGSLKTIYFHDIDNSKLDSIGEYAFSYCYNNVNSDIYIEIPKNVTVIKKLAYYRNYNYHKNVYFYGDRPQLNTIHHSDVIGDKITPEVFELGSGAKIIIPNFVHYPEYASSWQGITKIDGYPVEQNS